MNCIEMKKRGINFVKTTNNSPHEPRGVSYLPSKLQNDSVSQ